MSRRVIPVSPTDRGKEIPQSDSTPQWHHALYVGLGLVYLLFSFVCSVLYLTILAENATNDFWWRQFNTTGGQTFLADIVNAHLILGLDENATTLNLFSTANLKDYSQPSTFVDMRETAVRKWLLRPLSLKLAVETVRANSLYENMYTIVAPCWVDLGRQYEMAHTQIRQHRCLKNQVANAALYMETLLRNVAASDLTQSAFGISINQTILTPVTTLPNGKAWVSALYTLKGLSVADEVAMWQQNNLKHWTIQYQNHFDFGIQDKIGIKNALGVEQNFKISSIPFVFSNVASWSTTDVSRGLWNDMAHAIYYDASLVRHTSNYFETRVESWDLEYNGPVNTVGAVIFRSALGPLTSLDTQLMFPPKALVDMFISFQEGLHDTIQSNSPAAALLKQIVPTLIDIMPPAWVLKDTIVEYYSGNPLCFSYTTPLHYAQMPFNYYDYCQTQTPFGIAFDTNVHFAMFATGLSAREIPNVCQISPSKQQVCNNILSDALT
ncbi:Aste57867_553 [Aphanomyces stellatus]|uniref:Aste57867_553 protein n=1 Tax=Aphanomyces stellatus TaxID=120398 RepID=A0A485K7W9_9STRA|nr:hypothetical protein As57867_000552 [Aphanomyces stellatus]VFT77778.1 Aste57867_553 [Aphanomyces stellatus]